jgi:hypothetical protein
VEVQSAWAQFGQQVLDALVAYFRDGEWLLYPADLIEAHLEMDPDGVPVLRAVYDHPLYRERLGLRRRLDCWGGSDVNAEALAEEIAVFDISEPLGRYYEILVTDEQGVAWWGDGYRDLPPALFPPGTVLPGVIIVPAIHPESD